MSLLLDILLDGSEEIVHKYFGENLSHCEIACDFTKEQLLAMLDDQEFVKKKHCVDARTYPEKLPIFLEFCKKYPRKRWKQEQNITENDTA